MTDAHVSIFRRLFDRLDRDKNARISADEMRSLIVGVQIEEVGLSEEDGVNHVMEEFDISGDSSLSRDEFIKGISNWLCKANDSLLDNPSENKTQANRSNPNVNSRPNGLAFFLLWNSAEHHYNCVQLQGTTEEEQSLMADGKKQSKKDACKSAWWNYSKASFLVLLGTAITILLSPSLLQTVQAFATTVNLSSFLVSYFLIPLALSFRQTYRAIISASEKSESSVSLTLSEVGLFKSFKKIKGCLHI